MVYMKNPESNPTPTVRITINLDSILGVWKKGLLRATSFYVMGRSAQNIHDVAEHHIGENIKYYFWKKLPDFSEKEKITAIYRLWLIESCIQQLERYFSIFLDRVVHYVRVVNLSGSIIKSNHQIDISDFIDRSISAKASYVSKILGVDIHSEYFVSIKKLRDLITHGSGVIRERDATGSNELILKWIGFDSIIKDGDKTVIISDSPSLPYQVCSEKGAEVSVRFQPRRRRFQIGEILILGESDFAEICLFFDIAASKAIDGLKRYMADKGVNLVEAADEGTDTST